MQRARRRPVEIEAAKIESQADLEAAARWIRTNGGSAWMGGGELLVRTSSGEVAVRPGFWVAHGPDDFYPISDEAFHELYDVVDDAPARRPEQTTTERRWDLDY